MEATIRVFFTFIPHRRNGTIRFVPRIRSVLRAILTRACSHYAQRFDNECEREEPQEEDVELFKA
jgi:hypothetical protein